jgi:hypothetical protein
MVAGIGTENCVLILDILSDCMTARDMQKIATGAFAGAAISVLSSSDFTYFKQFVMFVISFVTGILTCTLIGDLIAYFNPGTITISPSVGALISAALSVRFLIMLARDPFGIVKIIRGKYQ